MATTIQCDYTNDVAFVKFGCHHSSFKFQQQTKMTLIWSTDKHKGLMPQTIDGETTEVGNDLYVNCHAGHHHHDDGAKSSTDNYGHDNNGHDAGHSKDNDQYGKGLKGYPYNPAHSNASGSGYGSASGSIGKTDTGFQAYGTGSIGGSFSKENYNQGLPNIGH